MSIARQYSSVLLEAMRKTTKLLLGKLISPAEIRTGHHRNATYLSPFALFTADTAEGITADGEGKEEM
jgi:hypothetical protein